MTKSLPICILGTGSYVPEGIRDNQYFEKILDTSDEWIVTRTGIRTRHYAAEDQATSDLAAIAGKRALEDAGLTVDDIDIIIVATATGDHQFPATAAIVQDKIGAKNIPAFDVSAACAGFLYASITASSFLSSGMYKRALVIGAEALSRFANWTDRTTAVLFGDAASAAVYGIGEDPDSSMLYYNLGCDGSRSHQIWVPAGGSRRPAAHDTVDEHLHTLHMKGREVYKFAVVKMQQIIDDALGSANLTPNDLALVIPHQSNLRIIESVREKMGLPAEKVSVSIQRYGNTSAASVPMGLDEARRAGVVKKGDIILMVALGSGLVWGTMIFRL